MKLSKLIDNSDVKNNFEDVEINNVTDKTDDISESCAFVCIRGRSFDGHNAAEKAVEKGAAVVITEKDLKIKNQVIVDNTRKIYAKMCSALLGNSHKKLKIIGITGTNGKTTTAYLIKDILEKSGHKTGMTGTVKYAVSDRQYNADRTTPEPKELHTLFKEMADAGCEYAVMEVSSMALEQMRVYGIEFEAAVFTNLTQDHLDYHITMENYLASKKILFSQCKNAIINYDDNYSGEILSCCSCPVLTYSAKMDEADYTAKNIRLGNEGVCYELVGSGFIGRAGVKTPGMFSVYNSMAAAVCCKVLGIDLNNSLEIISASCSAPGRCEVVKTDTPYTIIIDYAHTPDALENIISSVRGFCRGRIITVFGCGGDRDKSKRPVMGRVASQLSDIVIVTSDNPRTEDPQEIIKDILNGINKKKQIYSEVSRREAVKKAMKLAAENDIIILAGKGHETYQIFNEDKTEFDERKIIFEILKEI